MLNSSVKEEFFIALFFTSLRDRMAGKEREKNGKAQCMEKL